jgi:Histidine kinase-, DNA gyrase B-, and HSP90-like ATPase
VVPRQRSALTRCSLSRSSGVKSIVVCSTSCFCHVRRLAYSPETAIADLVDNSIVAEATTIELELEWNDGHPQAALLDNGNGMDRVTLAEALRFGGAGPSSTRTAGDLGRFGLGLKTASLSQCRRLTIISRKARSISVLVLDIDEIAKRG